MFVGLGEALQVLFTWHILGLLVLGTLLGSWVAIMPGLSNTTMLALLLSIVVGMDQYAAFVLLTTVLASAGFAGSTTAILINVPGDSTNAATLLDGFPLSRQGKAGLAIGASAASSGIGAFIGFAIVVLTLPVQRQVVLSFGPPEVFALAIAGVALIAVIGRGDALRGAAAGLLGLALGFVGLHRVVGGERFTFGVDALYDGIPLVAAVIGLFALPEMVQLLREGSPVAKDTDKVTGGVMEGVLETLRRPRLLVQSSTIGALIGMVPGVGGVVASWAAYWAAQKTSKEPETFGAGNIEGVIAPEASIDTSAAGSLIPVFVLGLPGSAPTALIVAAFAFHGVLPGRGLLTDGMPLVWVMLIAFLFANVLISVVGLFAASAMVRVTLIPVVFIAPLVFVFASVGAYADGNRRMFGILAALAFGLLGIVMQRFGFSRPALIIGLILSPLAERAFHQSMQIHGSMAFVLRPISFTVLALTTLAFLGPTVLKAVRRTRRTPVMARAAREPAPAGPALTAPPGATRVWSRGEFFFLLGLLVFAALLWLTPQDIPRRGMLFPRLVLPSLLAVSALQLVRLLSARRGTAAPARGSWWAAEGPSWLRALGWLFLLPLLVWVLGVVYGAVVYVALFLVLFEGTFTVRRFFAAAVSAISVGSILHFALAGWLGLRFGSGVLL